MRSPVHRVLTRSRSRLCPATEMARRRRGCCPRLDRQRRADQPDLRHDRCRGRRPQPHLGSIRRSPPALSRSRPCTTGGTLEPVRCGSDEWRVQNGRAAQGGLVRRELAARGVAGGARCAGKDRRGCWRSLAGLDRTPEQWQRGPRCRDDDAEIMAKPFATLGDNMSRGAGGPPCFIATGSI